MALSSRKHYRTSTYDMFHDHAKNGHSIVMHDTARKIYLKEVDVC